MGSGVAGVVATGVAEGVGAVAGAELTGKAPAVGTSLGSEGVD